MVFQNPEPLDGLSTRQFDRRQDIGKYYCVGYCDLNGEEGLCARMMKRGKK